MHNFDKRMDNLNRKGSLSHMVQDFTLNLLAGGRHACTPAWDKARDNLDQCYKVYVPESGAAFLSDGASEHALVPGRIYLISGYKIASQRCPARMDLRWVHFIPASYYLHRCLNGMPMIHSWPLADFPRVAAAFGRIEELFENPASARESRLASRVSLALTCRVEALILILISELLESNRLLLDALAEPELEQLRPAIDYMDVHFWENPTLSVVAARANLAPNYFHRLFRRVMGVTPFEYIEARRLETARHMLGDPRLRIKQVAESCGYDDALYFSRVFRRHFGVPPTDLRKRGLLMP